jgi:YggT family protein
MAIVRAILVAYLLVLFVRSAFSWVPAPPSGSVWRKVDRFCFTVTEPLLRPIRKLIPPLRMGVVGLDVSILILMLIDLVILRLI